MLRCRFAHFGESRVFTSGWTRQFQTLNWILGLFRFERFDQLAEEMRNTEFKLRIRRLWGRPLGHL